MSLDVAWAYPPDRMEPSRHNLAPESIFGERVMTDGTRARKADLLKEEELAGCVMSVAVLLFRDRTPVTRLETTLSPEFKKSIDGIDLSKVTAATIKDNKLDLIPLEDDRLIPKDQIAGIPYKKDGKYYYIQITPKGSPVAGRLIGKAWPISDMYEISVYAPDALVTMPVRSTDAGIVETAEEVARSPEAVIPPSMAPPSAPTVKMPEASRNPPGTTSYSFTFPAALAFLVPIFETAKNFIAEHPFISAGAGIAAGAVVGMLAYRKFLRMKRFAAGSFSNEKEAALTQIFDDLADVEDKTNNVTGDKKRVEAKEKTAVVIGAGRIGRGLIGKLLNDSGYKITFVNRSSGIVDALNRDGGYNLQIVGNDGSVISRRIGNVIAIAKSDTNGVTNAIYDTDTVFLAVFDQDFDDVSSVIAKGIENRLAGGVRRPINVIVVSNRFSAKHVVRDAILRHVSPMMRTDADALLGVVDTATFDIIPGIPDLLAEKDPSLIQVYSDMHLFADNSGFRGELLRLKGIDMTDNIKDIKLRKLFVYNGAHAICAYLGYLKRYEYIQEAINDPAIRGVVGAAFEEMRGLLGEWPDYDEFTRFVIARLADKRFNDKLERVAKDPIRKLSSYDRLVSPALLAIKNNKTPHAYAMGIAAALLYDDPADEEAVKMQARLAEEGGIGKVISEICGLRSQYKDEFVLIDLIRTKIAIARREKAKAELAKSMKAGIFDEDNYDKVVHVLGKVPKNVKLVVWDFDNVIGNTQKLYAEATAIVYWKIRKGIKEADAIPEDNDPVYRKGKDLYNQFLAEGPATFRTIQKAIEEVKSEKELASGLLPEAEYYKQFEAIREAMFSVLDPSDFFNPRMRELLCIVRALNPDVEFCVNTALEKSFFERQFMRPGFRGYFTSAKALSVEQRNAGNIEEAKARNLMVLLQEKGVKPEETVVIDDSSRFMNTVRMRAPDIFRIGVATDIRFGKNLIDKEVNVVFMNMKPTPEKLMMLGLNKKLLESNQDGSSVIKSVAPDVYMIRSEPKVQHDPGAIDWDIETAFSKKHGMQPVRSETARKVMEQSFEALVRKGSIKPNVIVNIKDFSPNAVAVYMSKLKEVSEYYNGNVTFVLVVENNIERFRNDMPSMFSAVAKAQAAIREAAKAKNADSEHFGTEYTMMIADGGRKMRNMPLTLAYLYEGLMPYEKDRIRLQEVFVRTGALLMQMPKCGVDDMAVVGSDSVFNSEKMVTAEGGPLASLRQRALVVPVVQYDAKEDMSTKIVRAADAQDKTQYVLVKPGKELLDKYRLKYKDSSYSGLHFLAIWKKSFLSDFLQVMQGEKMDNGDTFLELPCDMFMLFFQSVLMPEDEWAALRPSGISERDWKKARELSTRCFGQDLAQVRFVKMEAEEAFTDEGILETSLPRFSHLITDDRNVVKKSPDVDFANATAASLDHVIVKGSGKIVFGKNVKLSKVIIELNGEELNIPDNWTIVNSYLSGDCKFKECNSCVERDAAKAPRPGYILNGVFVKDGKLKPLAGMTFEDDTASTVLYTIHGEQIVVTVSIDASKAELDKMRFTKRNRSLMGLQVDADIQANIRAKDAIEKAVREEILSMPKIFPLSKDAVRKRVSIGTKKFDKPVEYAEIIKTLEDRIKRDSKGEDQYWVTIEGIQGAGKTYMINELKRVLEARGKNVVVIEEDWYHRSRMERDHEMDSLDKPEKKTRIYHAENWHKWGRLRDDIKDVKDAAMSGNEVTLTLKDLYNRDDEGQLTRVEKLAIKPGTIFIYSGFYVSDKGKVDIDSDLSIYIGINQEDSLIVKRERDKWRPRGEVWQLDDVIYRPAFEQYISTYDPAASSDIVIRFDNIDNRKKASFVMPLTKAEYKDYYDNEKKEAAKREREIQKQARSQITEKLKDMMRSSNNTKAMFEEAANRVVSLLRSESMLKGPSSDHEIKRQMTAAEIRERAEKIIVAAKAADRSRLPPDFGEYVALLKDNLERLEPDAITASLIVKARRASREGKKLIIGIETDWIPGINDKSSLQHNTVSPLIKAVEAVAATLRSLNLEDVVEVVHSDAKNLAGEIMKRAGNDTSNLSNVVILASSNTVDSPGFEILKSTPLEERAFIAAVDTTELEKWYKENEYSTKQPDVKIVEMLSIALELSVGNIEFSKLPIVLGYDAGKRLVIFLPRAVSKDIEELKKIYDLQIGALRRMA